MQDGSGQSGSGLPAATSGSVRRTVGPVAVAVSAAALVAVAVALVGLVDRGALLGGLQRAIADPIGIALITAALLGAFSLRAVAWIRLLPGLGFWPALAAIHLSLGANHVLPFRLGEPLRVVAAVRRGGVTLGPATATTVILRSADIVALLLLGLLAGPGLVAGVLGRAGLAVGAAVVAVGVALVLVVRFAPSGRHRLPSRPLVPGPRSTRPLPTVALVASAWLAEAVVVWRVAGWFDVALAPEEALLVLAVAVGSQILAVTPGGVGTYEAAASAALVAIGVPLSTAIALALTLHGVKTIYSLAAGGIAIVRPRPGLLGRWRLPRPLVSRPAPRPQPPGPVVLFLPAYNEGPRLGAVIAAAPETVAGRPVEVIVVDDGSTDDTGAVAVAAGATVVGHEVNRGLGAAVHTGLAAATERGAAAVAFCDADGEYDPGQLADLVTPILDGRAHYVVGSRFAGTIGHMQPHRRLGNRVLTRWVRHIVGQPVTDGQSGYRAFSAVAAAEASVAHDYNYAQVITIDLVAKGFGYHEVPITYRFRTSGRSFVRLVPYLAKVVPTVWSQLNAPTPPVPPSTRLESCPWPSEPVAAPLPSH